MKKKHGKIRKTIEETNAQQDFQIINNSLFDKYVCVCEKKSSSKAIVGEQARERVDELN